MFEGLAALDIHLFILEGHLDGLLLVRVERLYSLEEFHPLGVGVAHLYGIGSAFKDLGTEGIAFDAQRVDRFVGALVDNLDDRIRQSPDLNGREIGFGFATVVVGLGDGDRPAGIVLGILFGGILPARPALECDAAVRCVELRDAEARSSVVEV